VAEIYDLVFLTLIKLQDIMGSDYMQDRIDLIFPKDFVVEVMEFQEYSQDDNNEVNPWFLELAQDGLFHLSKITFL